jgi:hypothetical protein
MFGLEALEERCYGEEVEDHVHEVEMHQRKQIEAVHYTSNVLALYPYMSLKMRCSISCMLQCSQCKLRRLLALPNPRAPQIARSQITSPPLPFP